MLETILTSPDPSLNGFDENGNPLFANETRTAENIKCILHVQNGIKDYIEKYVSICPTSIRKINKRIDDTFLRLMSRFEIRDKHFLSLVIEDPFFNRSTEINHVI